jgi:hypothetical protein
MNENPLHEAPQVPLIWTSKGNLPVESLRYVHGWSETETYISFEERWYAEDGELVKNNTHVYSKRGVEIGGQQALMA